jgi:hypothetical protein
MAMVCDSLLTKGPLKGMPAKGTAAGYKRHLAANEQACNECTRGQTSASLAWQRANPNRSRDHKRRYRAENADKISASSRCYREANAEVIAERTRQWQRDNPDKNRAKSKRWRAANPDKSRESVRAWARSNPSSVRNRSRRSYRRNPEKYREFSRRRRACTQATFTVEELDQRMSVFGYRCWICRGPFEQVDHVKPLAAGGTHILANLRPSCKPCNLRKNGVWPLPGWIQQREERRVNDAI